TNVFGAAPGGSTGTYPDRKVFSSSLSYVSGSHALKTGMQWSFGVDGNSQIRTGDIIQNYISNAAGVETPNSVTVYNTPTRYFEYVNADLGVYAQDVWTMRRLTVSPGVRIYHFNAKTEGGCRAEGRVVAGALPGGRAGSWRRSASPTSPTCPTGTTSRRGSAPSTTCSATRRPRSRRAS